MPFSDHLDALDEAVADTLGDPALYYAAGAGDGVDVSVILERPTDLVTLDRSQAPIAQPMLEVRVSEVARLRQRDEFAFDGRRWRVEGAGYRPGDGRWWRASVADVGAAS